MSGKNRSFTPEFRIAVAQRILAGESVTKIHHELSIKRSVLYRWRDAYRKEGAAGLNRKVGRAPGVPHPAQVKPGESREQQLERQVAELQRKVGEQTLLLDFFERAFKRVEKSRRNNASSSATASARRSGQ